MKCPICGSDIPESMLLCPDCGHEIQMVPDYNPLDDVLARQIEEPSEKQRAARRAARERAVQAKRQQEAAQLRRKRREAKKRRRRQRRTLILLIFLILLLGGIFAFVIYRNSYNGLVNRGERAYSEQQYSEALSLLNKAIEKKPASAAAYEAIYKVYIAQNDTDTAEELLLGAVGDYPDKAGLYKALFNFYIDSNQSQKIAFVLEDVEDDSLLDKLDEYRTAAPKASLEEGTYDDVQQVTLTASGAKAIYYTTDGSDPDKDSKKYSNPIQIPEGDMLLQAVAVNEKGIESLPVTFNYTVELPIADAPAVTPSTGQYTGAQKIEVTVPDGYTCYYTTDGSEPTAASEKYEGPIDMPAGNTIFSAVLLSPDGKLSDITKRNYERL